MNTKLAGFAFVLLFFLVSRSFADTFGSGNNSFTIDFVTVGNPGNPPDPDPISWPQQRGAVGYEYRLGTYEISRQMVEKADVAGNLKIANWLGNDYGPVGPDRPALNLPWNAVARFVNWLNVSMGYPPAYRFLRQPGEPSYNANWENLLWRPTDAGYNPNNPYRNTQARYFLPSADEWLKAACYDPSTGVYNKYPTGNAVPIPVASGTAANTAVYAQPNFQGPADITVAGGLSAFGTMAQGGNVSEWTETDYDLVNDLTTPDGYPIDTRGFFGSDWRDFLLWRNSNWYSSNPNTGIGIGFRIASTVIPEPTSLALVSIAAVMLAASRFNTRRT